MPQLTVDDALAFIVDFARTPQTGGYSNYGYEIYLPNVLSAYLQEVEGVSAQDSFNTARTREISPILMEAAWELCRKGLLRPGIKQMHLQATDDGASGNGFTVTSRGRSWLESGADNIVVMQPGRLNSLFLNLSAKLGGSFLQRAQEAAACHFAGTYLACCAMCGAAAESILLRLAIAKVGNEDTVLRQYLSAGGRQKIKNTLVGQAPLAISRPFESALGLLSYWRDDAAHGIASTISEIEAHEALARLLRFAQFCNDNWEQITAAATATASE